MFFSFPQQGDSGWAGNYSPAQLDGSSFCENAKNAKKERKEKRKQPSATHFCQLHITHVFDDVSREGDKDRLDREAPSILQTDPQNQADS